MGTGLTDTQELRSDVRDVKRDVQHMSEAFDTLSEKLSQLIEFRAEIMARETTHKDTILRIFKRIEEIEKLEKDTSEKLNSWLNRGWGAWFAFTVLIGIIFAVIQFNFSEMHQQLKDAQSEIQYLREKQIEIRQRLKSLGVTETSACNDDCPKPPIIMPIPPADRPLTTQEV